MKKNGLVTMSGGTTQVINATLIGISDYWSSAMKSELIAGVPGISGFLQCHTKNITYLDDYTRNMVYSTPGSSFVGTTRIASLTGEEFTMFSTLVHQYDIGYFINIGGNGTLKQTMDIQKHMPELRCASAAKTIDNDLGDKEFVESYFTPGFQSTLNYWKHKVEMLDNENFGACSHDKVLVAQTFGRETGFIAGAARLADPERKLPLLILLPEDQQSPSEVLLRIQNMIKWYDRCIVVISEGYKISSFEERKDKSGQTMYGSSQSTACQELVNLCMVNEIQARLWNPTIEQRQDTQWRLESDLKIAHRVGVNIVNGFENNYSAFFSTIHKDKGIHSISFNNIQDYSRKMLPEWIDYGKWDVTDSYVKYMESVLKYEVK